MNKWNIIAFSTETSGAIRRTTINPPVNTGMVHRIHQLERTQKIQFIGTIMVLRQKMMLTCHLEVQMTPGNRMMTVDMDDPNLDPPQNGQPPFPPHPPPSMPPSMPSAVIPTPQQPMFSNPDETVEQVMQPVADEESSSEEPHITEPERVEIKQRHMYHMTPTRNRQRLRQRSD